MEDDIVVDHAKMMARRSGKTRVVILRRSTAVKRAKMNESASLGVVKQLKSDRKKTSVTIQDVDRESMKYIKNDEHDPF